MTQIDINPFAIVVAGFIFVVIIALYVARRTTQRNGPIEPLPFGSFRGGRWGGMWGEVEEPKLVDVYVGRGYAWAGAGETGV